MGEVEGKIGRRTRSDLRHDWHTVSLLTDHLVVSPKYRGGGIGRRSCGIVTLSPCLKSNIG
jgi:GNAT superfamily N-acetyltransferase